MNSEPTVLVERTGKRLKAHTLLSVLVLLLGIVVTLIGANADNAAVGVIAGVVLIVVGLVWLCITKARVWWSHG